MFGFVRIGVVFLYILNSVSLKVHEEHKFSCSKVTSLTLHKCYASGKFQALPSECRTHESLVYVHTTSFAVQLHPDNAWKIALIDYNGKDALLFTRRVF